MHGKGLKFGIYEDFGNYTCAGYPGVIGNLQQDAETFASWDVDYVKLDGCYAHPSEMDRGYPEFGFYLNRTGRSMIYSCSWPVYQIYAGIYLVFPILSVLFEYFRWQIRPICMILTGFYSQIAGGRVLLMGKKIYSSTNTLQVFVR